MNYSLSYEKFGRGRERERDGVKVVFLKRKRRISSNELYYMWIIVNVFRKNSEEEEKQSIDH